ncbi:hypothetical protein M5K25_021087 [Dendrobium thyrsiflorum]|uniref:Uncharacterized protein n=1 Tax=Dendrobium thyrsiflorum TaxID=117978 RepID=A0ABD0UBI1_DENTH
MVVHVGDCGKKGSGKVKVDEVQNGGGIEEVCRQEGVSGPSYGPWVLVNNRKGVKAVVAVLEPVKVAVQEPVQVGKAAVVREEPVNVRRLAVDYHLEEGECLLEGVNDSSLELSGAAVDQVECRNGAGVDPVTSHVTSNSGVSILANLFDVVHLVNDEGLEEVVCEGKFENVELGGGIATVSKAGEGLEVGKMESLGTGILEGEMSCVVGRGGELSKVRLAKELKSLGPIKKVTRGKKMDGSSKLVETKINAFDKVSMERVLGTDWEFFLVPSNGFSGGILILWRSDLATFTVLKDSEQCVIGELHVFNKGVWVIATVYGSKDVDDKRGGRKFSFSQGPKEMRDFMLGNDLHDIGFVGPRYTWCNNKTGGGCILERLDRCLLNSLAISCIQVAVVRHLARIASDHYPLVLKVFESSFKGRGMMRFEDVWLSYRGSAHIVSKVWKEDFSGDEMEILNKKCRKILKDLFFWSKAKVKEFSLAKEVLKKEIFLLQEEEANVGWLRRKRKIARITGIKVVEELDYLGTKFVLRRLNKADFQVLLDNAMRLLNILPSFLMTHTLIPLSCLRDFEKLCRNFIWIKFDGGHGLHYVAWDDLCLPKSYGGWVLHSVVSNLDPMRAKLAWKLVVEPNSLLSRVLLARYGKDWWRNEKLKGGLRLGRSLLVDGRL